MPGLSLVLLISLAILISLGLWQYQRLQWKTALLAEIEASVTAPPLKSLSALERAIVQKDPVDFRRIEFMAAPVAGAKSWRLYSSQRGGVCWDIIEPLKGNGVTILAKIGEVNVHTSTDYEAVVAAADAQIYTGYVRKAYPMGRVESWVKSKASEDRNRYFHFDQLGNWYDGLDGALIKGYYIDSVDVEGGDASDLPVQRPEIANNHFDYMLTWWSFALIFLIIYLILHKRAGRLSFR